MKIVHIISALPIGGAEKSLFNLISKDLSHSNEHIVVSLSDMGYFGSKISDLGVTVISMGLKSAFLSFFIFLRLFRVMNNYKPDIIQGWMYQGNLAAWLCKTFFYRKAALIWNIRHSLHDITKEKKMIRLVIFISKLLSKHPNTIIYNSRISKQQHEKYKFNNKKSIVIHNGFDTKVFFPSKTAGILVRESLKINKDKLIFANFSRYHPMKNHEAFIFSAVRLLKYNPHLHFLMAGDGVDLTNLELVKLIPSHLLESFSLLGPIDDVSEIMKAIDILCVTSSWGEGLPNVIGESMATGIFCISTDVGDSSYIIDKNGKIVRKNNNDALYKAMSDASNLTHEERNLIGIESRKRVVDFFSIDLMIDNYNALYKKIELNEL